jgi:predicted Zn-dependent peptidase
VRRAGALASAAALALGCAVLAPRAWQLPPPPPPAGAIVPADRLHRFTLENGLEVLVLEDPRLPRVVLGVAVRRGAADDPPGRAGVASYTAELLERGAGARGALAFAEAVDALGASFSASAGWDSMDVGITGLSRDTDALAGLLADAVLRPRFDASEAERLRAQTLAGIERSKDDPETLARRHFARVVYPEHRYGLPLEGTPDSVERLDARAAREFHGAVFVPGNAILYATGAIGRDDAERLAQALFGAWRGELRSFAGEPAPVPAPSERAVVVVDRPELSQAVILVGHEGISRTAEERIPVQLMNTTLGGGGFSSRIMSRVRESEGLAYYAYSSFSMRRDGGTFAAATGTRVAEAGRAVAMLVGELERARREPPSALEVRHAKSLVAGRFALGLETAEALVAGLIELDVYGLPDDTLDTYRARVRDTPLLAVQLAARDRLHPERAAIVAVGPAAALGPQLEAFGPVRVTAP